MKWRLRDPQRIDVDGMVRRASNRVSLHRLIEKGNRDINVLSREMLDKMINHAVLEVMSRYREEGTKTLALTEARLASESRRELDSILRKVHQLAEPPPDGDVYVAEEEKEEDRRPTAFEGMRLELGRGLDLGTVNICASAKSMDSGTLIHNVQRNAFLDVRADGITQSLLLKFGIGCVVRGGKAYVIGDRAFELASIFDKPIRRPMKDGMGSGSDAEGVLIVNHLLELLLGRAQKSGEICAYSVPGESADSERNFIYYRGVVEHALRSLGYCPRPMIESHVIVQAEFMETDYTGIGITCGGGLFNICVACKGVPALTFSTSRGGDWVDQSVAQAIGAPVLHVSAVKERGMDLGHPQDHVEGALAIYIRHLLQYTVETMRRKLSESDCGPSFQKPVEIVCAGGTAMMGGFLEMFREELQKVTLPIQVSNIRMAKNPLQAVASGCLRAALEETRALEEGPVPLARTVLGRAAISTSHRPGTELSPGNPLPVSCS